MVIIRSAIILCIFIMLFFGGCECDKYPLIKVKHEPVIARSNEQVTFTVTVLRTGDTPCNIDILVNAALVHTITNAQSGQTYTYTGGPFTSYEGTTVSYLAKATDNDYDTDTRGYYYFAITDANFDWALPYMPARYTGPHSQKEDLIFHRANDYTSFKSFVDDAGSKIWNVYDEQAIIEEPNNLDNFNFYIYSKIASVNSCGTIHSDADTEMPWRNTDAILHVANFGDCTNLGLSHFTAEGGMTKAFLHESGHAVFGLADEYDGPTYYFQPANEPNIWSAENGCRSEQTTKGRDPDVTWEFTSRQGGWWGIQHSIDNTVMQRGNVGDTWGIEAAEHVRWWFVQF